MYIDAVVVKIPQRTHNQEQTALIPSTTKCKTRKTHGEGRSLPNSNHLFLVPSQTFPEKTKLNNFFELSCYLINR